MADFARVVRNGVALANRLTESLQPFVTVNKAGTVDGGGDVTPGATFEWPAMVDWKSTRVRTREGVEATSRASVQFLEPHEIDEEDQLILPDGTTGPILDMSGFIDKETGRPFTTTVWLG